MKKIFIITVIIAWTCLGHAQENQVFYYDEYGGKIYLNKIENTKIIHFKKTIDATQKESIRDQLRASDYTTTEMTPFSYKVSGNMEQLEKSEIISTAAKNDNILYISDMLLYSRDSTHSWSSNKIFVNVRPDSDLRNLLQENKIPVVDFRQFGFDKQTYLVELDVTENSAIEYANRLFATKDVTWAQPSFRKLIRKQNPYYPLQWGLNNTAPNGVDINATNAWNISTGAGVKVAVIDEGVDLTHPDLINNLLPGYDATDALYGGSNGGYGGNNHDPLGVRRFEEDAHGTACAGIIAAMNNSIGVKGVAYNAKIIPIRIAYSNIYCEWGKNGLSCGLPFWVTDADWQAEGIYKAWHDYDADILSNSWGGGQPEIGITAEINVALTYGRNGKGCVVVFASGNDYDAPIIYPANLQETIAVGAINSSGQRASFFCYGPELDVVAPGVLIPTTDIQSSLGYNTQNGTDGDYVLDFSGTSAACPHLAGVAALILSANPNLTGQQVRDIIESTAQKVSGYNYQITSGRPNGTWNNEMGYGLVNAYAAVQAACPTTNFTNQTVTTNTTIAGCDINVQNVTVTTGATLTLDAEGSVTLGGGFEMQPGSGLEIK